MALAVLQNLANAIRMVGSLEALEQVSFVSRTDDWDTDWAPGMLPVLARALASGVCHSLRVLGLRDKPFFEPGPGGLGGHVGGASSTPSLLGA